MPNDVSPLVLTVVGGVFTIVGILLKIVYDGLAARRQDRREALDRFAPERKEAYEEFLTCLKREREYWHNLHELAECHRRGEDVPQERMDNFPASPMSDLVSALERVRRVAPTYQTITAAESVLRLFVDMAESTRAAINSPGPNDEITWFLLQRYLEDREREFVYAYRLDLGIGPPIGGPKNFPMPERPWPADVAEGILRAHMPRERKTRGAP
ncbi:hypothetical protein ACGIF2_11675 [Cellulomonas sp. P22]|uniref:hypothetical protein n=1 Tax=Cellulomonas sp. P22 TaxID=3373189 RepID=UPI00378D84D8